MQRVMFLTFLLFTTYVSSYANNEEGLKNILDKLNEFTEENKRDVEWLKQENLKLKSQNYHLESRMGVLEQENKGLKSDISSVQTNRVGMYEAPLGSIIAWTPMPDANTLNPTSLPEGWVLCDGSVIEGGIWDGRTTPNLNGEKRFLRGGETEEVLTLEDEKTNYRDIFFLPHGTGNEANEHLFHCSDYAAKTLFELEVFSNDDRTDDFLCQHWGGDETRPKNMNVLWIMKVIDEATRGK